MCIVRKKHVDVNIAGWRNLLFRHLLLVYNGLMLYVWSTMLVLLNIVWLALVVFGLPGNWLIVISTFLFALWRRSDGVFSIYTLIVLIALCIIGELVEFFSAMGGARKAGAGWVASFGAIAGAITGAILGTILIPIPFFGTLLGACAGAGVLAWGLGFSGGKEMPDSVRHGVGAGLGQFLGTSTKVALGCVIWLIVAVAAYWP